MKTYNLLESGNAPIKSWTHGVPFDEQAQKQLKNIAGLPFIHKWIAAMPDVHLGKGAAVGSVIPTIGAVIPSSVGVDIGCGMMAAKTNLSSSQLPENLKNARHAIENAVPHGRSAKLRGRLDKGSWNEIPDNVGNAWGSLSNQFSLLCEKYPVLKNTNNVNHLGTLGTGNHFIEVCLDENDAVWIMLHSGSRGVGNQIGRHFIELAKKDMQTWMINLPDQDLAYFPEGTKHFNDYIEAVEWAQNFAKANREVMMMNTITALRASLGVHFKADVEAVDCHHNYVTRENHYGKNVLLTRKGAVSARKGELGIIPGSMGTRSFIVRGLGNPESFHSCSHGAGRVMSRTEAKKIVTMEDHMEAIKGVECKKDVSLIDETPTAYKPIDKVMAAQEDLVEIVYTLKQVICVKG